MGVKVLLKVSSQKEVSREGPGEGRDQKKRCLEEASKAHLSAAFYVGWMPGKRKIGGEDDPANIR